MELILGAFVIGIVAAIAVGFIYFAGMMLGLPMERRKTVERRQAIAQQMQRDRVNAEAARNIALRAAERRLGG